MATANHVFGACIPQTDTGTNNAYEVLGVTMNGGTVELETHRRPIYSDIGGPESPVEWQQMGGKATIRFKLIHPDEAVVTKIRKLSDANLSGNEGTPGTPGTVMGAGGHRFSLYLPSSTQNPWVFSNCMIAREGIKESSEADGYDLTIEAWRYIAASANSVANTVLYTRTAPS